MIKTKAVFLEDRLFSSQSELLENFSNCSDWLDKSRPQKSHFCINHVNRLNKTETITHLLMLVM